MTSTTKTKKTKGTDIYPPNDIREQTKVRRAWVEAKIAELMLDPSIEAKSVGIGSYQHVSVWHLTSVAARIQLRGTCPGCAGLQALDGGVLVLHGYKRPGDGYVEGRCVGTHRKPVEIEREFCVSIIEGLRNTASRLKASLAKLEAKPVTIETVFGSYEKYWALTQPERKAQAEPVYVYEQKVSDTKHSIWNNESFAKHLEDNALPKHGQPITEVLIAD